MYKDVTKELKYEPLIKKGKGTQSHYKYLVNRVYHKKHLVATLNDDGVIQRQVGKEYMVVWDMGTLRVLEAVMEKHG